MTPAKLNVFFSFFPYGGNGGCATEHPNIRSWFAQTITYCNQDNRIGKITACDYSDTPIPMMRNRAVCEARDVGSDVLVMVDSDQHPDLYLGQDPTAVPFFQSSFDFLYERKIKGLCSTIGAPYCGPPPSECPYIFRWANDESNNPNDGHHIEMYGREEASIMTGIQHCAALPTGCIMFDMKLFEVTDPKHEYDHLLKRFGSHEIAKNLTKPWFYYEYKDIYQAYKASTEDVTASRDMLLCAHARLGYACLFVQWSSWAGHWKPKCVGKPISLSSESINDKYTAAVLGGRKDRHHMMDISLMNASLPAVAVAHKKRTVYNGTVDDTITLEAT